MRNAEIDPNKKYTIEITQAELQTLSHELRMNIYELQNLINGVDHSHESVGLTFLKKICKDSRSIGEKAVQRELKEALGIREDIEEAISENNHWLRNGDS